ncbi:MAG: hypothetical protein HY304_05400 [candidate division Zixibacteria bacterium]|nr:hypothetical protein [candidate division Zixibacteria bacterium]
MGLSELIGLAVIPLAAGGYFLSRNNRAVRITGPTVILQRFNINEDANAQELVAISGRAAGLVGWLLGLMGIGTTSTLSVTRDELRVSTSGLAGRIDQVVPLVDVSSTHCGSSKPLGFLFVALAFGGMALAILLKALAGDGFQSNGGTIAILLIIGGVFLLVYLFSRKILLSVETRGGAPVGLTFKPSLAEGVAMGEEVARTATSMDEEMARRAISILNQQVLRVQLRR